MNVVIWDNALMLQSDGAWIQVNLHRIEEAADALSKHTPSGARVRLIYEPEFLVTEIESVPKGGSKIVRQALADRYTAIDSQTHAFAYHEPVQATGRNVGLSTYIHAEPGEGSPGLLILKERVQDEKGIHITGAWPILTLLMDGLAKEHARAVIAVIVHEAKAAIFGFNEKGERFFQKIRASSVEGCHSELRDVLQHAGVNLGGESKLAAKIRFYAFEPKAETVAASIPWWSELAVLNTVTYAPPEAISRTLSAAPKSSSSNLIRSLPGDIHIDGFLKATSVAAIIVLCAFVGRWWQADSELTTQISVAKNQRTQLRTEVDARQSAKNEIETLKELYGSDVGNSAIGQYEFAKAIAENTPGDASITFLQITESTFKVNGQFWQAQKRSRDVVLETLTGGYSRAVPGMVFKSASYDPQNGAFSVEGSILKK